MLWQGCIELSTNQTFAITKDRVSLQYFSCAGQAGHSTYVSHDGEVAYAVRWEVFHTVAASSKAFGLWCSLIHCFCAWGGKALLPVEQSLKNFRMLTAVANKGL